jgi:cold-inducible RNA-binding protein
MAMSQQNKIYVGNLSYDTTQDDLTNYFSQFGDIEELKLITDRDTGRSKGFGFITFSSPEGAQRACNEANDTEFEGRTIKVNMAKDDFRGGGRSGGGRGGRSGGGRGGFGGGDRDRW